MHIVLTALAVLFVIAGFFGFALGGIPTLVFWFLAAMCILAGWRSRPARQRQREDRFRGGEHHVG